MQDFEIEATLTTLRDRRFADGDHPVTDQEITDVADWVSEKPRAFALTDLGNAERYCSATSIGCSLCYAWDKWLIWDGRYWVIDNQAELIHRAHITIRRIYLEAANTN